MTDPDAVRRHVTVVGAGAAGQAAAAALLSAGIADVLITDEAPGNEVVSSVFDDATDTWSLRTDAGGVLRSRVVIWTRRPPFVPWTPNITGRNNFRGASFHSARWDADFDPTGKRIAVVGADSAAGHHLGRLTRSASSVTVFAHAPRRIVDELPSAATRAKRRLRGSFRPTSRDAALRPALVGSAIAAITSSGIHTSDGVEHRADAIVYGTGFAVPDEISDETLVGAGGITIRRAWDEGMEPCFGVAVHGFPNYFFVSGSYARAQAPYVVECLRLMQHGGGGRVEVRRSSQQVFNERAFVRPVRPYPKAAIVSAFEVSAGGGDVRETYDGEATLTIAGTQHPVHARLAGRLDPIDGLYHWQGTLFTPISQPLPDHLLLQSRTVTLTVGERDAPARIVEKTPWGTHSVAGVGAPPYGSS